MTLGSNKGHWSRAAGVIRWRSHGGGASRLHEGQMRSPLASAGSRVGAELAHIQVSSKSCLPATPYGSHAPRSIWRSSRSIRQRGHELIDATGCTTRAPPAAARWWLRIMC